MLAQYDFPASCLDNFLTKSSLVVADFPPMKHSRGESSIVSYHLPIS